MENKIKIIDAICERHPSYGVEKGWSEYTGGMADTGSWFLRKMLDVDESELQSFLDKIILEENRPKHQYTSKEEADMKKIHHLPNGFWMNEFTAKKMIELNKKSERIAWFGHEK